MASDATPVRIDMPAQGNTGSTRIGNHIVDDRLQIHIDVYRNDYTNTIAPQPGTTPHVARLIIVRWLVDDITDVPSVEKILDQAWANVYTLAPLTSEISNRRKFEVVYDKVFNTQYDVLHNSNNNWFGASFNREETRILNIRKNHYFTSDGVITGMGNYWCFPLTNVPAISSVGPTIDMAVRFWFRDP